MSEKDEIETMDDLEYDDDMDLNEDLLNSDSDDSDTDSSEDMEDAQTAKLEQEYNEILKKLQKQKYSYDDYIILIDTAHKLADLDKIRQSIDMFAQVYPVAPNIWLKRLKIESNIATTEAEYKRLNNLFKRALADYFSVNVALEYANFASNSAKADEIWEELTSTYALDCMQGSKLFKAWRTYINEKEAESPEKYLKMLKTYDLELSIPLGDMEMTYVELKVLAEQQKDKYPVDWSALDRKYNKAKDGLQKCLPFEEKLAGLSKFEHQERAKLYMEYIDKSKNFLEERFIQILYERMITDCCLNVTCWLNYIKYVQSHDGYRPSHPGSTELPSLFSQTDWDIVNRAIRNCTWSPEIYVEKMRIAERMELSREELQTIAEFALAAGFEAPEPLVTIWLEYLSYLRRNTDFNSEREIGILRATFELAWDTLGKQFGELADCDCEILQMWGRLEYGPLNDFGKAKELWTTIMNSGNNSCKSGLWIEFSHLEMKRGVDGARKVFRKALSNKHMDNINVISSAWIRLERCNGTLEQLISCQEQCAERLSNETTKSHYGSGQKGKPKRKAQDRYNEKSKYDNGIDKKSSNKTDKKDSANSKADQSKMNKPKSPPPSKRPKLEVVNEIHDSQYFGKDKDNVTIFLSNLDYTVTCEDIIVAFPELNITVVNIIKSNNGKSRGFGYATLKSEDDVKKSLEFDRRIIKGRPTFISSVLRDRAQRVKFRYSDETELTKLFVKGLPFDVTKDELMELFGKHGPVKDVRLVCRKNGNPKGLAYVEYENEKSANQAVLKMSEFELRHFKVSVFISSPPPRSSKGQSSNPSFFGDGRLNEKINTTAKPRLAFIPRAVQQKTNESTKPPTAATAPAAGASSITSAPKTNEDFRNLFKKP